jgi:primosomal protein N' (replication factor Y)
MTILRVALDVPLDTLFDYASGGMPAEVGQRVLVPFGPRKLAGIVLEKKAESDMDAKRIKAVIQMFDGEPLLSSKAIKLLRFCADYYHAPIGQVIMSALPARLRDARLAMPEKRIGYRLTDAGRASGVDNLPKGAALQKKLWQAMAECGALDETALANLSKGWRKAMRPLLESGTAELVEMEAPSVLLNAQPVAAPQLNEDQQQAVDAITTSLNAFKVSLLYGITGSGKTEVYMRVLESALQDDRAQVLVLVPEINLTPQLEGRFRKRFPNHVMVSLHSQMSDGERLRNWRLAESGQARIVIGTRLSVFTPIPNLRLIVVDEEHDGSYKQQDGMRYSARDVAVVRAKQANVPIVLGSATPALETWHNAQAGRYALLTLRQRAVAAAELPEIITIDARTPMLRDGLTPGLIEALRERLKRGEQSLLFINRRGYSPVLLCSSCAWVAPCQRCTSRLVVHLRQRRLKCHHCGHEERIPAQCPGCGNPDLHPTGQGTQRLENTLAELLPEARILRVDRDSTRNKGSLEKMVAQVHDGKIDILIGTQMLAKGHDFPNLTLVGVVDSDGALFSPDYRAAERLFAQLMQVAGRAGRADKPGEVLIQTCFPDHVLFHALKQHDYAEFAATLLEDRRMAGFPPYCHEALMRTEANRMELVQDFMAEAIKAARPLSNQVTVYDPVRPQMERLKGMERAQLLVQAASRKALQQFLQDWVPLLRAMPQGGKVRWSVDVDPLEV